MKEIGVGLLGLGNVGAGVIKVLADNAAAIEARLGTQVRVRAIAVRSLDKDRLVDVDPALLTTDVDSVIDRDDIDIVCELIGGIDRAKAAVLRAIERRKHVVTANKALLAEHGEELFPAAESGGVDIYYEAAVCGGVPVIRTLREGLASDRIDDFYGIVNGTSNFVLSTMAKTGLDFDEVLADAQARGYAEADPALDVSGKDAAHKLAILIMLCFGTGVDVDEIYVEGIDRLAPADFRFAERIGSVIKPLVIARNTPDGIEARVHPTMIPANWMLADVPGAKNALYVHSYALGASMYYGAGAGMMPTAMAVVSDLIEVARNVRAGVAGSLPLRSYRALVHRPVLDIAGLRSRYYLRFSVPDRPGVLGRLTTILGKHGISIAQVVQDMPEKDGRPVVVVVVTHEAVEGDLREALADIGASAGLGEPVQVIRIMPSAAHA
ncbi:homoserine dehydrogenase [Haliangium sp.]|uniref:homoserine dehydrogenase n=1 Tax=Haliangium sp. TaxID=2663208 RepID=UPI003D11C5DF